VKKL
jgi:hypothetical protein